MHSQSEIKTHQHLDDKKIVFVDIEFFLLFIGDLSWFNIVGFLTTDLGAWGGREIIALNMHMRDR